MKIKKNDNVKVLVGKDRGKTGKVLAVNPENDLITVEGVNQLKKNVRPKRQGEKGQIVAYNAPFRSSRVMVVCPKCGKASRVGYRLSADKKMRVCKKCKAEF